LPLDSTKPYQRPQPPARARWPLQCAEIARASRWAALLSGNSADGAWELAENELFELHLGTGIVDIDADERTAGVVVELHALRDFPSLHARLLGEVNI